MTPVLKVEEVPPTPSAFVANRWTIAIAGILMQVALGAVYAWSVFRVPLSKQFGWSISDVTLTFTIAIFAVGFAAFFGGLWLNKQGPRVVAMTGGVLYGLGVFLASFSANRLWWLYLSYGLIGGIGLGLGYIVPVSVLVKWFPDKRGLITGVAVGGFGLGALVTAPLANHLIASVGVLSTFAYLGIAYGVLTVATGYFMQNPPANWNPPGWNPKTPQASQRATRDYTLGEAVRSWQWWALWLLLFINTSAGISIISQESPLFQELAKVTALTAAGMVGIVAIGNAIGRVFWAWLSDILTRRMTFVVMFVLQVALFWFLPSANSAGLLTLVTFIILMCYGGGFGTMPAFAADYFGPKNVGSIYGLMLTAWGFASAFGPLLIAHMREVTHEYGSGLHVVAGVLTVSIILPFVVRPPKGTARWAGVPSSCHSVSAGPDFATSAYMASGARSISPGHETAPSSINTCSKKCISSKGDNTPVSCSRFKRMQPTNPSLNRTNNEYCGSALTSTTSQYIE